MREQGEKAELSRCNAARMIRSCLLLKGISQGKVARKIGIQRQFVTHFLNRNIDLLPHQINKIFSMLKLEYHVNER